MTKKNERERKATLYIVLGMMEGGVGGYPPSPGVTQVYKQKTVFVARYSTLAQKSKQEMSMTHAEKLERDRQRYKDNIEEARARSREAYVVNREVILQAQRSRRAAFSQEKRDHYALYQREWRKKNREHLKATRRANYARDPQKEKIKQRRRYLRYREKRLKQMKEQRDARLSREAQEANRAYHPKATKPSKAYKPRTYLRLPAQETKRGERVLGPYIPRPARRLQSYKEKPRLTPASLPQTKEPEKTTHCIVIYFLLS